MVGLRSLPALVAGLLSLALVVPGAVAARSVRGDLGAATGSPKAEARAALERFERRLRVEAGSFAFESVRRSAIGTHVRGRQFVDGLPVDGSSAIVSIIGGRLVWVQAQDVSAKGGRAASSVGARAARAAALGALGVSLPTRASAERLLVPRAGRLTDTYRISVLSVQPAVAQTVEVSAASGRVLSARSDVDYAEATAPLFDPNPVVATKNPALRQPGVDQAGVDTDVDSPELTAARVDMAIREYDTMQAAASRLVGPWVNAQGPQPFVQVGEGRFDYTRGMPGFEALMAYAHVDRFQRYLQEDLGFTGEAGVNSESQDIIAFKIEGFDNSFYQPANDIIVLGTGGVDDGEDADVIIHEYGHAVQDAQVKGWGAEAEGGAMGEAWGDFQAAAYFARLANAFNDECVADWDATSYSTDTPACLRRLDSKKVYPKDVENEVHADGELWSAFLWRIRDRLGATPVEKSDLSLRLVLASHELLTPAAKFADGVAALRTAATAQGHPEWVSIIDDSAIAAGFITSPSTPPASTPPAGGAGPGGGTTEPPAKTAPSVKCTRKLTCKITAPAGSAAASANRALLLRGKNLVARGKVTKGKVKLRASRKIKPGKYTLELRKGSKRVHRQAIKIPR
jgi:hypothetical protein